MASGCCIGQARLQKILSLQECLLVAQEEKEQYLRQWNNKEGFKTFYGEISYVVHSEVREKRKQCEWL